jgi:hypothetical protein
MILTIYRFNPAWPAPAGRTRHQHSHSDGSTYWVETDGAAPTNSDVSAVLTPAYVQSNVTDLASAKTLLARILLALSIVVKA